MVSVKALRKLALLSLSNLAELLVSAMDSEERSPRNLSMYPLLKKLGIERCGFHAFRHGNATVMDQEHVPIATRLNRLGQSDSRTTMGYTHAISEDGRRFAARIGELLTAGSA